MQQMRMENPTFDKNEMLQEQYGMFALAKMLTEAPDSPVTPETRMSFEMNPRRDITIPVLKRLSTSMGSGITCRATGDEGVSALFTPTFSYFHFAIDNIMHRYDNNDITEARMTMHKYKNMRNACLSTVNGLVGTMLSTYKTQVMKDKLLYAVASNTVNATYAQREFIMRDLDVMMQANRFGDGETFIVGNSGIQSEYYKLMESGMYNAVNKDQQTNKMLFLDNSIANATGKYATCYAVKTGSMALLFKFTPEQVAGDTRNNEEWGITDLPGFGKIGFHRYSTVGDHSSADDATTTGLTCSIKDTVVYSFGVAVVPAYNSDITTIANPIIKADIAAA